MSIRTGMTRSFKLECFQAVHDFRVDTIKCALYASAATLSPETTVYAATNEVSGEGYTAGGFEIDVSSGYPVINVLSEEAEIRFDDKEVTGLRVTFRGLLIYNASKANRAICVVDRGSDQIVRGTLRLRFPAESPAYIRMV